MDGFLKGKCLPGDMLVNETNAEYLVRKFAELQSALDVQSARSDALAAKLNDVCAENAAIKREARWGVIKIYTVFSGDDSVCQGTREKVVPLSAQTPATDAWVNEQRAAGRVEGVNFAAARLAAAFNHGFIDKPTAEVYDVVKAVLGAKEELATAPDDGLSGEYAEQALNDWAAQLRGSQV
ncbi:hypothetical protein KDV29_22300 [Atlantibacter hermannii]